MRIRLRGSGHAASLLSELNRCRLSRSMCDVVLQVGGRSFPAHRAVLACAASYFHGLLSSSSSPTLTLDSISPGNFEKVLSFIYTAEIFTDLIDVGVLYELAERLGVRELLRACRDTFPDLHTPTSNCGDGEGDLEPCIPPASVCSSSSVLSSVGSSAAATPSSVSNPVPQAPPPTPKAEDVDVLLSYGHLAEDKPLPAGQRSVDSGVPSTSDSLQLVKVEQVDRGADPCGTNMSKCLNFRTSCPDLSAELVGETCAPSSSCGDQGDVLQRAPGAEDGDIILQEQEDSERVGDGGERWAGLAGDVIELSDDEETYAEEEEEEEDLVCVENGIRADIAGERMEAAVCKACGTVLPVEVDAVMAHAETHVSESGVCQLCGCSFVERESRISHVLLHVGVPLFSCDMCLTRFCNSTKLVRHLRQSTTGVPMVSPPGDITEGPGTDVQCAVCSTRVPKEMQAVRQHLLSHVCVASLRCGVCRLSQPSLCSLLWHLLSHLRLPVFPCPRCGSCFTQRSLLERHVVQHTRDAERESGRDVDGLEELRCFLCPATFRSASAFQQHLSSQHTGELQDQQAGALFQRKRKAPPSLDFLCSSSSSSSFGFSLAAPPVSSRAKWYRCRYCGKRFAHSGEFTYHLRIHTGEKPYQCKVCLRFFRGRSTMICHLKTHAGALMYRCTVCGLYFSTLKLVSSHMEQHKDSLPPDFNIEQTFMYSDHSKEPLVTMET